jgi:5-methylcytosine-specific restriction endonuclease McrA
MIKEKACRTCKEYLPINYFHTDKDGYTRSQCKLCKNKRAVELRKKSGKKYKTSPEVRRKANHKRRVSKYNNGHTPYTEQELLDLYGSDCHICTLPIDLNAPRKTGIEGWEIGLHIEHLIPISKGGPDNIYNVRPAHGWCNISKGVK